MPCRGVGERQTLASSTAGKQRVILWLRDLADGEVALQEEIWGINIRI